MDATAKPSKSLTAVVGIAWAVLARAIRPSTWPRTTRDVLARQVYFTGLEAVPFVSGIAFLVGASVVSQAQIWLSKLGQIGLLGPLLVGIVVTNLAPLLVNFVVIGRSGTAITAELAGMEVSGQTRILDALGLDPFLYLVVPRVLGVVLSVFGLTVVFIAVALASGYGTSVLLASMTIEEASFVRTLAGAMGAREFLSLAGKSIVPGLVTGSVCCLEGLSAGMAMTEIPQAATRAVVRSVVALFVFWGLFSVLVGV
ncbi:MAG: ABC transporter permease [Planctomycetes bacterium]|nr:ABC transporter permease [Planctomycetota bacterium]